MDAVWLRIDDHTFRKTTDFDEMMRAGPGSAVCSQGADNEEVTQLLSAKSGKIAYFPHGYNPNTVYLSDLPLFHYLNDAVTSALRGQRVFIPSYNAQIHSSFRDPKSKNIRYWEKNPGVVLLSVRDGFEVYYDPKLKAKVQAMIGKSRKKKKVEARVLFSDFSHALLQMYKDCGLRHYGNLSVVTSINIILDYDTQMGRKAVNRHLLVLKRRWNKNPVKHYDRFKARLGPDLMAAFIRRFGWKVPTPQNYKEAKK